MFLAYSKNCKMFPKRYVFNLFLFLHVFSKSRRLAGAPKSSFHICLTFLPAWLTQSDLLRTLGIAPNLFKGKPGGAGQSLTISVDLLKGWLHQFWLAFTLVITRGCSWIGWHQIGIIRIKIWTCLAFAITGTRRCTNSGVQVQCTQEGAPNIMPSLANTSTRHHKCTNICGNYLRAGSVVNALANGSLPDWYISIRLKMDLQIQAPSFAVGFNFKMECS